MQARFTRILLVLCLIVATGYNGMAQNAARIYIEPNGWSIGTNAGLSDLWGDVGTKTAVDHYTNSKYFDKVAFMGGMFGRYTVHPVFGIRFMMNFGTVYATDKWNLDKAKLAVTQGDDAYQRYARGQDAKSIVFDGGVLFELTPFRWNPESKVAHKRGQLFFGAGVGFFHYTPYSTVGTSKKFVETYDLHLEGQDFGEGYPPKYSLWGLNIPLAIGYRWDIGQHLNIGIEYLYRMTFTDYLDGVSGKYIDPNAFKIYLSPKDAITADLVADKGYYTGLEPKNVAGNLRGNASNNDAYSTLQITFYYKVHSRTREWWHSF